MTAALGTGRLLVPLGRAPFLPRRSIDLLCRTTPAWKECPTLVTQARRLPGGDSLWWLAPFQGPPPARPPRSSRESAAPASRGSRLARRYHSLPRLNTSTVLMRPRTGATVEPTCRAL